MGNQLRIKLVKLHCPEHNLVKLQCAQHDNQWLEIDSDTIDGTVSIDTYYEHRDDTGAPVDWDSIHIKLNHEDVSALIQILQEAHTVLESSS